MEENKQMICNRLLDALVLTRYGCDLESLIYNSDDEIVTITYKNGYKRYTDVSCDSGYAMIKDILSGV